MAILEQCGLFSAPLVAARWPVPPSPSLRVPSPSRFFHLRPRQFILCARAPPSPGRAASQGSASGLRGGVSAQVESGVSAARQGVGGAGLPGAPCIASRWRSICEACTVPVQKLERDVDGAAGEEHSRVSPRRGGHPRKSGERKLLPVGATQAFRRHELRSGRLQEG